MALLISPTVCPTNLFSKPLPKSPTPLFSPQFQTLTHIKLQSSSQFPRHKTLTPLSSHFTFNIEDEDLQPLDSSPWEGAVIYKRDASVLHVEFSTTLERLGLERLSSAVSKCRASDMGIRLPHRKGEEGDGTPVLVSVDVSRRKMRLKLDGIVRTVITLGCNRCAEPAAESVFSNFALLLTEDPIEDSDDEINMGVIYGEDKHKSSTNSKIEGEEDDEKEIDPDDRLYFPSEEKEIDISKPIRDLVHLEITLNALCNPNCKGLCLRCGTNLNKKKCNCKKEEVQDGDYGPLKNLRKQMQQR